MCRRKESFTAFNRARTCDITLLFDAMRMSHDQSQDEMNAPRAASPAAILHISYRIHPLVDRLDSLFVARFQLCLFTLVKL